MRNEYGPLPFIPSHVRFVPRKMMIRGGENISLVPSILQILNSSGVKIIISSNLVRRRYLFLLSSHIVEFVKV
jgi:hypothetical protein